MTINKTDNLNTVTTIDLRSWSDISWKNVDRSVKRLRRRIFKATKEGNYKLLRRLQRLMVNSLSNVLYSTRRVTSLSSGRKTAGVDEHVALTNFDRVNLALSIHRLNLKEWIPSPVRRIYIPKPDGRQRPLGIPTIRDRVIQAIVLNALEPEWEAQFEPSSYGFRPGKSVNDAIHRIHSILNHKDRVWVVEADIKGCFDNIDHSFLMNRISGFPYSSLVNRWLKAGILDGGIYKETDVGTPQGGVISPLLCNIALHGLEEELGIKYNAAGYVSKNVNPLQRTIVRYADDFVVICPTKEIALKTVEDLEGILRKRGLSLNTDKTKVSNTLDGFDFLGFNISHIHKLGWSRIMSNIESFENGIEAQYRKFFSTIIKPSDKSIRNIKAKLKQIFVSRRGSAPSTLIKDLNPVIRGYCESKRCWVFSRAAKELQNYLYILTMRWVKRRHPKKSTDWVVKKYYKHYKSYFIDNKWTFHDPDTGIICFQFFWFSKTRMWPPVIGRESPDNPESIQYWMDRQEKLFASRCVSIFSNFQLLLAESQKLTCPVCEESLIGDEQIHMHHIIAKRDGGKDTFANLVLVHMHCHQHVHYVTSNEERQNWLYALKQFKNTHPRPVKGLKNKEWESFSQLEDLVD